MEPRIELNGGTSAPATEEPVTVGYEAPAPPAVVIIPPPEAESPAPKRGPAQRLSRSLVAWIVAAVMFAAAGALAVTYVGEHGRLAGARAELAAEQRGNASLKAQVSDLTGAKSELESRVAELQGRSDDVASELRTCVGAVNSMDRLIQAMSDALNSTTLQEFNKHIDRANRLVGPAGDAESACLAQADAGTTSM